MLNVVIQEVARDESQSVEAVHVEVRDGEQVVASLRIARDAIGPGPLEGSLEHTGLVKWELPE